ncbi:MAG: hypothetical protein ACOH14_06455 [Rhodoglobus sp.]
MVDSLGMVNAVSGSPSYTGRALRQLSSPRYAGATALRPLGARSGVRSGTAATTVTATSTTWTAQPFGGVIDGQAAVEAGPYEFAFDAVATGAVTPASASFARIDIIYVQVDDPAESDGSTVPAITRKYLAGTVASTPPTLPARSMLCARINVPISGGGAPTVTWVAPYCAAAGGVVDFNTKAELDLWITAATGTRALVLATETQYFRSGGAWRRSDGFIIPTALAGCTVAADGLITVSGSTLFAFDCGTGWDEIEITSLDLRGASAGDPNIQLRNGGASLVSGYTSSSTQITGPSAPSGISGASTSWPLGRISSSPGRYKGTIALGSKTENKQYTYQSQDSDNVIRLGGGRNTSVVAYTAVQINSGPAITGTFRVKGVVPS